MPTIEPQVVPDDHYSFSLNDLDKFIIAIERRLASREVMHIKEVAAFSGISVSKVYRLELLPYHNLPGLEGRLFLRSEIIEAIANSPALAAKVPTGKKVNVGKSRNI